MTTESITTSPLKDPRTMITPHAFAVAPELLGLPLATPARRLAAIIVDVFIVLLLSRFSALFFVAALSVMGLMMWRQPSADNTVPPRWQMTMRWIILLVFVLWGGAQVVQQWQSEKVESAIAQTEQVVSDEALSDADKVAKLEHDLANIKNESDGIGVIGSVKAVLSEIGFEFGWATIYFSLLTTIFNGQTLGKKVMSIQVVQLNGKRLSIWASFNRAGGYAAGAATGMLGFAQMAWDANRQAIHDKIANTAVIDLQRPRYPVLVEPEIRS